jgi:TolB-like protein
VHRVAAVYGGASFFVIEVADTVFPRIPLPEWTVSLVVWLAILGFPVALLLSWALEITPDGLRWTAPSEEEDLVRYGKGRPAMTLGVLATGLVLLGAGFWAGTRARGVGSTVSPPAPAVSPGLGFADPSADPRPAIAVLPFADVSQGGDQQYFSDGVSEEILNALSRIRDLRVAARSSAFAYRDTDVDARAAGLDLGVPYVLSGSVRKVDDRVRISAELLSVDDGFRRWGQSWDRTLDDIFAIQTEIALEVARELRVPLGLPAEDLSPATLDTLAYGRYLAGRAALRRRGSGVAESVALFAEAVERDSAWAPAWAGLAEAQATLPLYAGPAGESRDSAFWASNLASAERAARRALALDSRNASARVALGSIHRDRREWAAAEQELLRALDLDPDNGEAYVQYAETLWGTGRLAESLRATRTALALDRTPVRLDVVGFVLYQCRRYDEAIPLLEEGLTADPEEEVHFLRTVFGRLLLFTGREEEATTRFASFFDDPEAIRMQAAALAAGDPLLLPSDESRVLAQTWALLGDTTRAMAALERQVLSIPFRVPYEIWDPALASLWPTEWFQAELLPRLNLAGARADCGTLTP